MRELVLRIRISDAREQINGGFCKKLLALIDGGKLNLWQCGINDVVKAEQGNILGDRDAVFVCCLQYAERHGIGRGEDRSSGTAVCEQLPAECTADVDRGATMRIVDDLRGDTCFFQCFGKAAQTKLVRQAVGAVAQIDNVTVAELQQMLCCQTAACQIINADRVDLIAADECRRSEQNGRQSGSEILDHGSCILL